MRTKDAVAIRIQQLCAEKGIAVHELAMLSGVAPSTVYSMLDPRRRELSVVTVKKLCDGLDISISDFFDDEIFRSLEQEIQ